MWCSAGDTHLKLLDHVVSGVSFLTGVVFECDIVHRRSVFGLTANAVCAHKSILMSLLAAEPRSTI